MVVQPDFKRLELAYEHACDLIPCLRGVNVDARASAVTMMADGYPLVGPINHKQNYWLQVILFYFFRKFDVFGFFENKLIHFIGGIFRWYFNWRWNGKIFGGLDSRW